MNGTPLASLKTDLNNDGKPDIVSLTSNSVITQLGNGDGTFFPPQSFSGLSKVVGFDAADLNHDGNIDLAIAFAGTPPGVQILYGTGTGSFVLGPVLPLPDLSAPFSGSHQPTAIAIGRLNQGERPDIAVLTRNFVSDGAASYLLVATSHGRDNFDFGSPISVTPFAEALQITDLNNDRRQDIVVANSMRSLSGQFIFGGVQVFLNDGKGGLAAQPFVNLKATPGPIVVADLNHDGNPDVAALTVGPVSLPANSALTVLLGDGQGGLTVSGNYGTLNTPTALAAGDYNSDGIPDLIAGAPDGGVVLFPGKGDGSFPEQGYLYLGASVVSIFTGDFSGDGVSDILTTGSGENSLVATLGAHACQLQPTITTNVSSTIYAPYQLAASADLNGDGHTDLIGIVNSPGPAAAIVSVILSNGDGTFQKPAEYSNFYTGGTVFPVLKNVVAQDINLDGKLDLVVASNTGAFILTGNGDGTFQQTPVHVGSPSSFISVADVNKDGIPDLLMSSSASALFIYLGLGGGAFQPPSVVNLISPGVWQAVGDFNHDGGVDIAIATPLGVEVLIGAGGGNFTRRTPVLGPAMSVTAADVNNDGNLDLITDTAVSLGDGHGNFGAPIRYSVVPGTAVLASDFDADGKADIAVASPIGTFTFYKSKGDGTFEPFIVGGMDLSNSSLTLGTFSAGGAQQIAALSTQTAVVGANNTQYTGYVQLFGNVVFP
jgi:hypothetical protein